MIVFVMIFGILLKAREYCSLLMASWAYYDKYACIKPALGAVVCNSMELELVWAA